MSTRVPVALDFDDTLISLRRELLDFFNAHFGTAYRHEDMTEFRFGTVWPLSDELFTELFTANIEHFHQSPPLPGVLETLAAWAPEADFHIITGRHQGWIEPLTRWLARHRITVAAVQSCTEMGGKGKLARSLGIRLAVEDNAHAACSYAVLGIKTFLLNAPYNQCPEQPNLIRVNNWHDIRSAVPHLKQIADTTDSFIKDYA
jgi:uncharacterized HAD superfamily protein